MFRSYFLLIVTSLGIGGSGGGGSPDFVWFDLSGDLSRDLFGGRFVVPAKVQLNLFCSCFTL